MLEGGKLWPRIKAVAEANGRVPHMLQILDAARNAKLRVFYAMHRRYRPGDFETWRYFAPIRRAAWSRKAFKYTTWGGEFRAEFVPAGRHGFGRTQRAQMRHGWIVPLQRRRTCPRVPGAILSGTRSDVTSAAPAARIGRCTPASSRTALRMTYCIGIVAADRGRLVPPCALTALRRRAKVAAGSFRQAFENPSMHSVGKFVAPRESARLKQYRRHPPLLTLKNADVLLCHAAPPVVVQLGVVGEVRQRRRILREATPERQYRAIRRNRTHCQPPHTVLRAGKLDSWAES